MKAYELADALQETEPYYPTDYKLFDNAANMLRQQADRIADLETTLAFKKMKPLSDEEIMQISHQALENSALIPKNTFMIAFAKAIEERHGIK